MITSLTTALLRVTLFWYSLGLLLLFVGPPRWLEARYERLMALASHVPQLELAGLLGAAKVQWNVLLYWTVPLLVLWLISLILGVAVCEIRYRITQFHQRLKLKPTGQFGGVTVASFSLGHLPQATVPQPVRRKVKILSTLSPRRLFSSRSDINVLVSGQVKEALGWLTQEELTLCQELIGVLFTSPMHYAGAGHGVGLLEHTLNVMREATPKCSETFKLPIIAALAHDVGKLLTFKPDGQGGWKRVGLHSRESARILATLPSFPSLPVQDQRALLLAVKYDHAPSKMPELAGEQDASLLALRIINALSAADRSATAAEKDRNLEKIKPEDILWQDFVHFLREAPIAQRGKAGGSNQVNNPQGSQYLYIYEAPWREAAIRRLPEEVAAALDLTRRDSGRLAKYTKILVQRLRKEHLLLEELTKEDGTTMRVHESNPLWDIKSGIGEKGVGFRGVLVLHAEALWKKLNYKLGTFSPYPVTILAPNADKQGKVNPAPELIDKAALASAPDVTDRLKVNPVDAGVQATLGLSDEGKHTENKVGTKSLKRRLGFGGKAVKADVAPPQGLETALILTSDAKSEKAHALPKSEDLPAGYEVDTEVDTAAGLQDADAPAEPLIASTSDNISLGAVSDENTAELAADEKTLEESSVQDSLSTALSYLSGKQVKERAKPSEQSVIVLAPAVADTDDQKHRKAATKRGKSDPAVDVAVATEASTLTQTTKEQSTEKADNDKPSQCDSTEDKASTPKTSRSETRMGIRIADESAVKSYPHLKLGQKYYAEHARAVQEQGVIAGTPYPDGRASTQEATKLVPAQTDAAQKGSVPPVGDKALVPGSLVGAKGANSSAEKKKPRRRKF